MEKQVGHIRSRQGELPKLSFEVGIHVQRDTTGKRMVFLSTPDDRVMIIIARAVPWPGAFGHKQNILIKKDMPDFTTAIEAAEWVSKNL